MQSAPLGICDSQGTKLKGLIVINFRTVFQLRDCRVSLRVSADYIRCNLVFRPLGMNRISWRKRGREKESPLLSLDNSISVLVPNNYNS